MTASSSQVLPRKGAVPVRTGARLAPLVTIFLVSLVIPFVFQLGPLRFSAYRILLFVMTIPLVVLWLSGRAGRMRLADIALLLMCCWIALSYMVIHGPAVAIEAGGISFVQTMGAYFLARVYVRTPEDFLKVVQLLFWIIAGFLPFAVFEAVTGRDLALEVFNAIYRSYYAFDMEPRWGLRRVQLVFEHPILYGVFCSSLVAMAYFVLGHGRGFVRRLIQTGLVIFAAGLSLSSGPLTAMGAQLGLIAWSRMFNSFRMRWYALVGMTLSAALVIEAFSNRTVPQILISFVAFRKSSAWNRLRIWDYGSASVAEHPLFGIGQNDWVRARFMPASIDMFWLVPAVKHGLPSALLLQIAFFAVFLTVLFRKGLNPRDADYRTGYLISMMGLYLAGWTVHYWNAVYVLLMFLLGCGYCFLSERPGPDAPPPPVDRGQPTESRTAGAPEPSRYRRQLRTRSGRGNP